MTKDYPYDIWLSVGSDAGISFASVGQLAKDSSMMQGILLSLQSLMTTEVNVSDSQFMTGQNEFVRFGTFTMTNEEINVIVQYIVKSNTANTITITDENIVQELALAFGKFIMLTPNFYENIEIGRTVSPDFVSKSFLNACTIAKQKTPVKENNKYFLRAINAEIEKAIKKPEDYPTLLQMQNLENWFGEEEQAWERGSISSFKRQLIIQMFALDILNHITRNDPFSILQYEDPRYAIDEISNKIEVFLREKAPKAKELIEQYIGEKLEKKIDSLQHKLSISQIHTANTFIADSLTKDIVLSIAKKEPVFGLVDFREIKLYREIQKRVTQYLTPITQGNFICDAFIGEVPPLILQGARLFFNQLIRAFKGRELPPSVWSVITDFTFAIIKEENISTKSKKKAVSSLIIKKEYIKEKIDKLTAIDKKWKKELIAIFNKAGLGEHLEISNIEESVLVAKALERAIISTLEKIVEDQFFNSTLGSIFLYIVQAYKNLVPIYIFSNILSKIVQDLRMRELKIGKQLSITTRDLIGGAINTGFVKAYVNSVPVVFRKRFFGSPQLKFDGRVISVNELLLKPGLSVQHGDSIYTLPEVEKNAEILTACLIDQKILFASYESSIVRKMMSSYSDKIFKFEASIIGRIDKLITLFQKEKVSKLRNANLLPEIKETFPSFPDIGEVPEKFRDKDYHNICSDIWNRYAPKLHKILQELLTSFSSLRSNDIHYKEKAMKLYDKAIKDLKKQRNKLLTSWSSINKKITSEIEHWAQARMGDINAHIELVKKKHSGWIDDAFRIKKLQPNNFTLSIEECKRLVIQYITRIKEEEVQELPRNFIEIALSILLYRRIPDYVIDDSYNQMIQDAKNATLSVRKAWAKSKTRKEFESNLYINMRVLGNTLIKIINSYVRVIHQFFINKDLELSNDRKGFYIELGAIPKEIYSTKTEVSAVFKFDNAFISSSGKDWIVKFYIEPDYVKKMSRHQDRLVVISDIIRFVARNKFDENTEQLIDGIKAVTNYLVDQGDKRVIDLIETMKEAIFKLSDYPSISAVDKHDEEALAFS
ncbi:MAG: hypothetical protein ACTSQE_02970 [Candidatus Heimdallarchaeaceae archaeon]